MNQSLSLTKNSLYAENQAKTNDSLSDKEFHFRRTSI